MDESEDNMSAEDVRSVSSPLTAKAKPKKRSLVERELETNLTERVTSPITNKDGTSTSRYGRARRLKTDTDFCDTEKVTNKMLKSPKLDKSPVKSHSPAYKMHASNSPMKSEASKRVKSVESNIENCLENIYNENLSLSRFGSEEKRNTSPAKKFPKVYVRKDLIQAKDKETVTILKNIFSPVKSVQRSTNSHLNNILERSSEKYSLNGDIKAQNGYLDTSSVVKTLDFDQKKKKKDKELKVPSKSDLFEIEAKCEYQVGDLAWARVGTYPYWPCIVTREPQSEMFVKKKLFGRIERDVIHVTFFGDNGRRGWIVDNMLRKYLGVLEFQTTKEHFTPEARKRDPRLYAAFFISEKKLTQWNLSVEEAEVLLREPKRLRTDMFSNMLEKARSAKSTSKREKSGKIIARTDSDVSLSESLYDSLFSEDDDKVDDRSKNKSRNKSLDVSEVVTACLDNMAAKTGMTKIQRQSHMDRWLQKAKSKTPEKSQPKNTNRVQKSDKESRNTKKKPQLNESSQKAFRQSGNESQNGESNLSSFHNEHDYNGPEVQVKDSASSVYDNEQYLSKTEPHFEEPGSGIGIIAHVNSLNEGSPSRKDDNMGITGTENVLVNLKNENIFDIETAEKDVPNCIPFEESQSMESPVFQMELDTVNVENKFINTLNDSSIPDFEANKSSNIIDAKVDSNINSTEKEIMQNGLDTNSEDKVVDEEIDDNSNNMKLNFSDITDQDTEENSKLDVDFVDASSVNHTNVEETAEDSISQPSENKLTNETPNEDFKHKEIIQNINDKQLEKHSIEDFKNKAIVQNINDKHLEKQNSNIVVLDSKEEGLQEVYMDKNITLNEITDVVCVNALSLNHTNIEETAENSISQTSEENFTNEIPIEDWKHKEIVQNINDKHLEKQSSNIVVLESKEEGLQEIYVDKKNTLKENSGVDFVDALSVNHTNIQEAAENSISQTNEHNLTNEISMENLKHTEIVPNINDEHLEKQSSNILDSKQEGVQEIYENREITLNQSTDVDLVDALSVNHTNMEETAENSFSQTREHKLDTTDDSLESNSILQEYTEYNNGVDNVLIEKDIYKYRNMNLEDSGMNYDKAKDNENKETENIDSNQNKNEKILIVANVDAISSEQVLENVFEKRYQEVPQNNKDRFDENHTNKNKDSYIPSNTPVVTKENGLQDVIENYSDFEEETASIDSCNSEIPLTKLKLLSMSKKVTNSNKTEAKALDDPEFLKYLEVKQDVIIEENPELPQDDVVEYLYKTWLYEKNLMSDGKKIYDRNQSVMVKGLDNNNIVRLKRGRKKKVEKLHTLEEYVIKEKSENDEIADNILEESITKEKPKRKISRPCYNEDFSDIQDEIDFFESEPGRNVENQVKFRVEKSLENVDWKGENNKLRKNDHIEINVNADLKNIDQLSLAKSETQLETKLNGFQSSDSSPERVIKEECDTDSVSINSEYNKVSLLSHKPHSKVGRNDRDFDMIKVLQDPEFIKYLELRQDTLIDEHPELTQDEITHYLYKTWLYEENLKSDSKKQDIIEQSNLIKGLNQDAIQPKKMKKKHKIEKELSIEHDVKDKPKRSSAKPYYCEDISDIEDEIKLFEIFNPKLQQQKELSKQETIIIKSEFKNVSEQAKFSDRNAPEVEEIDEEELYFEQLTKPKPNLFKGLIREKVCEICEKPLNLVKCKSCYNMFHFDCVKKQTELPEPVPIPTRGRKKKKKPRGRKPKGYEDEGSQSDEKSQDANVSEEHNNSIDDIESESHIVVNVEEFETTLVAKMKELLEKNKNVEYESYSSDELGWSDTEAGQCKIVDIKLKPKRSMDNTDYSDFKCYNCQKHNIPVCFVCKSDTSPKTKSEHRQKCQVAHCHKYYHLECLDHWPQTQFNSGDPSKANKKINEHFEALTCPRHVCHTCVCDDPRGCKTRFSGDKLARCIRCPATYHTFTKCLPAGSKILTGSHIVCPRHYEHRPGKVPCHVNTGWCFICALGGTLICCEYCPTSFHAECLNIDPPEGGYMCEDCETGRLPLYGEMVWVKLGHYRWWPGIILHPSEIPDNIMAVKHQPGEFVVRFFGQYDHYWVNRGRVFPFQEGDSGRISSQKSKIDAAFTKAMEHASRACEILKTVQPNNSEEEDIASSLLPPHYVKLKVNRPSGACGALAARREPQEHSLTQCDCDPAADDVCGPYTQCLNRMLLTECGPTCRAGERCNNRQFEKRDYPKLVPYRTQHRGWGLKALEDIKKGQFVIEYVGELIDEAEFKRRMRRKHEIRDENFYFLTLDKERMIDAGPKGNFARFMNHCCEPNCETQKWTVLGDVRVGLFALDDIPANTELTFNYNLECAGIEKKQCMCGAKRCSGYIGAKPKQEETQPKKTKLHVKRTYKKRKPIEDSPSSSKNKPKRPIGRPAKPKELTEIEKDLLIIKNATNGLSSDSELSGRLSSVEDRNPKALKRKSVSFSTEEIIFISDSSSSKRLKTDDKASIEVGD